MYQPALLVLSLLCYSIAGWMIWQNLRRQQESVSNLSTAFFVAALAIIAHLVYALKLSNLGAALNFSLTSMAGLISAILVCIFFISSFFTPIKKLGGLVFPCTALVLGLTALWNSPANLLSDRSTFFNIHIIVAVVAYSILALATLQSLLYIYQERQLKNHNNPSILQTLPPLQTMESLLFQMLGLGFALLTFTLISGALFSHEIFGQALVFKHHTILALLGWLVFAWVLFRRIRNGLRGSQAVIWTVLGFVLIQLGYFGTKIINESLSLQ